MNPDEEKIRTPLAEQAGEWFVAHDEQPLDAQEAAALAAWLKTSPAHIEEFLGVSAVVRDLKQARSDPQYSIEAILSRARAADENPVRGFWPRFSGAVRGERLMAWRPAAGAMAAIVVVGVALLLAWPPAATRKGATLAGVTTLRFATRHGEQARQQLPDGSILQLDTDTAVSVRYTRGERLVFLDAGRAAFDVSHESGRAFRVQAGPAEIIDLGTRFDVRLEQGSTLVTVLEGRVDVAPMASGQGQAPQVVQLGADQQGRVGRDAWPATPVAVDARSATAWMHRQVAFHDEQLEKVAAELNRYSAKPIEIVTPDLRTLRISGVFATDDIDAFIAFLRSLKGVQVEVTATAIRVTRE
jgi:transmembrane sensor